MAKIDITVDQNQDLNIDIADASASANDSIGVLFYVDGALVLMIGNSSLGKHVDQITITAGVKYTVNVKSSQALKLSDVCTYELYDFNQDPPVKKDYGDVTITPLQESEAEKAPVTVVNGTRQTKVSADYVGSQNNDTILVQSGLSDIKITLPDPEIMIGKKIKVINQGDGAVNVYQFGGVTLAQQLQPPKSSYEFEAIYSSTYTWI